MGSLNKVPLALLGLFAFNVPWTLPNLLSVLVGECVVWQGRFWTFRISVNYWAEPLFCTLPFAMFLPRYRFVLQALLLEWYLLLQRTSHDGWKHEIKQMIHGADMQIKTAV